MLDCISTNVSNEYIYAMQEKGMIMIIQWGRELIKGEKLFKLQVDSSIINKPVLRFW